jgi:hypothetical protein
MTSKSPKYALERSVTALRQGQPAQRGRWASIGGISLRSLSVAAASLVACSVHAADPVDLTEKSYSPDNAVVVVFINWGRSWDCGGYENAQLQALTFQKMPLAESTSRGLKLVTPSRLMSNPTFERYVYVVGPGEYALTGFDVKVAKSVKAVGHLIGDESNLVRDGTPVGGTFNVNAGEVVYLGHFGLDCAAEPFLWRFNAEERSDFERLVAKLRENYPVLKDIPVTFRLFSTEMFGTAFTFDNPTVK